MLTIVRPGAAHAVTVSFPTPSGSLVACLVTNTGTTAVRLAAVQVFDHDGEPAPAPRQICSMGLVSGGS
jgi:hypothetical protein